MNAQKLAAYAEIVSSVAIVLTLIYLAIQTQQTNNILVSNSRQTTMVGDLGVLSAMMNQPEIMLNLRSGKELTDVEALQVEALLSSLLRIREYSWTQYRDGILDEPTWASYMLSMVEMLNEPQARSFWEGIKDELDPGFVEVVDRALASEAK